MSTNQPDFEDEQNALRAEKLRDTIAERAERACRFCKKTFAGHAIGVHESRCKENPDRLPGYGGKPGKLKGNTRMPRCPHCKHAFGRNGLATHISHCPMNPIVKAKKAGKVEAETPKLGPLDKLKLEYADDAMPRALLVIIGGKYEGFLMNGDKMTPLDLTVVKFDAER